MPYSIVKNGQVLAGPIERPAVFNGVQDFNNLSDAEVIIHDWYPTVVVNEDYNPEWQERTGPVFTVGANSVLCEYTITEKGLEEVRATKLKKLGKKRYEVETAGVLLGDSTILTDRESQAQITGAYNAARNGLLTTLNFKASTGWITLTAVEMEAIGQAVYSHVQNCFNIEKTHYEAIMALTTSQEVAEYDINAGW